MAVLLAYTHCPRWWLCSGLYSLSQVVVVLLAYVCSGAVDPRGIMLLLVAILSLALVVVVLLLDCVVALLSLAHVWPCCCWPMRWLCGCWPWW